MCSSIVSGQLALMASALENSPANTRVAIIEKDTAIQVIQENNGWFTQFQKGVESVVKTVYNYSPFAYFFGTYSSTELVSIDTSYNTAAYFKKVFGEKRISRIDTQLNINFTAKGNRQDYFYRTDVEKIFVGSSEITWNDLE